MLGIRLEPRIEADLEGYARAMGRSKSAIVRDLIERHLEAHSIDEQITQRRHAQYGHHRDHGNH